MAELAWHLLQPVDTGALVQQGFATGAGLMKTVQRKNALQAYMANPDDPQALGALSMFDPQAAAAMQEQRALQLKTRREAEDRQRQVALGELAVSDPRGAREEAMGAGDFDLAKTFGELEKAEQDRAADFWGKAGPVAFRLKQTADPGQRTAIWQEAKGILAATGAPAELLEQFDPTNDAQLDAAIATSQKVSELVAQTKPQEFNVGPGEGRYERDPITGKIITIIAPNPGDKPFGAPASSTGVAATLSSAGLSPPVVAGFLGNFETEAGYGGAKGDGGSASGIAQWRGDRQANFQRVVGKPVEQASPEEQARFVLWEMQNPEAAGMTVAERDAILAAKTPEEAAELIDKHYERSSGEHRVRRIEAAKRYAGAAPAPDPDKVRADARAAIAAGADPEAVRAKAAAVGVVL